jgi:hypothetical protein
VSSLVRPRDVPSLVFDPHGTRQSQPTSKINGLDERSDFETVAFYPGHLRIELTDELDIVIIRESLGSPHVIGVKKPAKRHEGIDFVIRFEVGSRPIHMACQDVIDVVAIMSLRATEGKGLVPRHFVTATGTCECRAHDSSHHISILADSTAPALKRIQVSFIRFRAGT